MARKSKAASTRATAKTAGVRVIAQQDFEGHAYGHEFEMPKGAKLTKAIADGNVRIDDRMPGDRVTPEGTAEDATAPAEGDNA